MYPNAFLLSLDQALSLKGYWAHTIRVIHVVVDEDEVYESIDKLKNLGGRGILIMTVEQMVA